MGGWRGGGRGGRGGVARLGGATDIEECGGGVPGATHELLVRRGEAAAAVLRGLDAGRVVVDASLQVVTLLLHAWMQ